MKKWLRKWARWLLNKDELDAVIVQLMAIRRELSLLREKPATTGISEVLGLMKSYEPLKPLGPLGHK